MKQLMALWSKLFVKLYIDNDQRTRESVHTAMKSLAENGAELFQPYLATLVPPWLLSLSDPHAQVRLIAQESFQCLFSPDGKRNWSRIIKQHELEVVNFIKTNILEQSPQTLSDMK